MCLFNFQYKQHPPSSDLNLKMPQAWWCHINGQSSSLINAPVGSLWRGRQVMLCAAPSDGLAAGCCAEAAVCRHVSHKLPITGSEISVACGSAVFHDSEIFKTIGIINNESKKTQVCARMPCRARSGRFCPEASCSNIPSAVNTLAGCEDTVDPATQRTRKNSDTRVGADFIPKQQTGVLMFQRWICAVLPCSKSREREFLPQTFNL